MKTGNMRRAAAAAVLALAVGSGLASCSSDDSANSSGQTQQVDLSAAPADTSWVAGPAGLEYPVSGDAGPSETSGPVPRGFAASPQGAVVAAVITQVFMSGADDDTWPEVSQVLLEPGPGRDQWAQARALMSVGTQPLDNPPVFRGFRVSDYSDSEAVVTLAVSYPTGQLAVLPVQMSRASGDWKAVLPTQEDAPDLQEISEEELKSKFTAFGPREEG